MSGANGQTIRAFGPDAVAMLQWQQERIVELSARVDGLSEDAVKLRGRVESQECFIASSIGPTARLTALTDQLGAYLSTSFKARLRRLLTGR